MGSLREWFIIWMLLLYTLLAQVGASDNYRRDSLNSFLHDYAFKNISRVRTGKLYNVHLPSNMSGIQVSIVRLRTRSLRMKGVNFSSFEIPQGVLPSPYTKRVDIVYQDLGNWWSSYYNVQNYTIVSPILGFLAYDSDERHALVELHTTEENPITIRFQKNSAIDGLVKCCRFDTNGTLEFSNVTRKYSCVSMSQGHFAIVIPSSVKRNDKKKWWLVGIILGVAGLVLFMVLGFVVYKFIKRKRMTKMVIESERSEGLDTMWVGRSRMPSASSIRTQPTIEEGYIP